MADSPAINVKFNRIMNYAAWFYEENPGPQQSMFALKEYLGSMGFPVSEMCDAGLLECGEATPVPFDKFYGQLVFVVRDIRGVQLVVARGQDNG